MAGYPAGRFAFPGRLNRVALKNGNPSLTVAGPRRFLTGLPCYAYLAPEDKTSYHARFLRVNRKPPDN